MEDLRPARGNTPTVRLQVQRMPSELLLLGPCRKVAMHELDRDRGFADRGRDSLDRPITGVTGYEDPGWLASSG